MWTSSNGYAPPQEEQDGATPPPRQYTQEELDSDKCRPPSRLLRFYERTVCLLSVAVTTSYLIMKWHTYLTTITTGGEQVPSPWISTPVLLSQTYFMIVAGLIVNFIVWHRMERPRQRLADLRISRAAMPTVDVLIPCMNEAVEVIESSVSAAMALDYPKEKLTVCVCDDGKREEVRRMATKLACRHPRVTLKYIARTKVPGVEHHAKAGNLNHALLGRDETDDEGRRRYTNGDFVVILDCDMVCKPRFLEAMLPHFYFKTPSGTYQIDEDIAFVQSPQAFTNVAAGDPLANQMKFFMGPEEQGWDGAGCAPCVGTNVVFQRHCLEAIGGFTYGSITEDFLTSMYLHAAGFKSKYVHEYLALGLAPETVAGFMAQRLRWFKGATQIMLHHNPFLIKGLSWKQRYLYCTANHHPLMGFPSLVLALLPFLWFIDPNIKVSAKDPYPLLGLAHLLFTMWTLFNGFRGVPKHYFFVQVKVSAFMLHVRIRAVFDVLVRKKVEFTVSEKGRSSSSSTTNGVVGDGDNSVKPPKEVVVVEEVKKVKEETESSQFWRDLGWVTPHLVYLTCGLVAIARFAYQALGHSIISTITTTTTTTIPITLPSPPPPPPKAYVDAGVSSVVVLLILMWQVYPPVGVVLFGGRERRREVSGAALAKKAQ